MLFVDVIGEEGQDKIEHRDSSEESICNITEAQLVVGCTVVFSSMVAKGLKGMEYHVEYLVVQSSGMFS